MANACMLCCCRVCTRTSPASCIFASKCNLQGLLHILPHSHKLRQQMDGTASLAYPKALLAYAFKKFYKTLFFVPSLYQSSFVCLKGVLPVIFPNSIEPSQGITTVKCCTKPPQSVTLYTSLCITAVTFYIETPMINYTLHTGVCHPPQGTAAAANKSQHVCQRIQPRRRGVWAVCKVWVRCRCCKGLWDAHEGCKAARAALAALV